MADDRTSKAIPIIKTVFTCLHSQVNNGQKCNAKKCRINGGNKWPLLDAEINEAGELTVLCWGKDHL